MGEKNNCLQGPFVKQKVTILFSFCLPYSGPYIFNGLGVNIHGKQTYRLLYVPDICSYTAKKQTRTCSINFLS